MKGSLLVLDTARREERIDASEPHEPGDLGGRVEREPGSLVGQESTRVLLLDADRLSELRLRSVTLEKARERPPKCPVLVNAEAFRVPLLLFRHLSHVHVFVLARKVRSLEIGRTRVGS